MKTKTEKILSPILVNAEEMSRAHPESFWIPRARSKVKKGDSVKVCSGGERFWTLVESFVDGVITATVDNHLICPENRSLKAGVRIQFGPCNVYQVMRGNRLLS